jgi:hypothetical protein
MAKHVVNVNLPLESYEKLRCEIERRERLGLPGASASEIIEELSMRYLSEQRPGEPEV